MSLNYPLYHHPGRSTFGLLPEPEGRSAPFITSLAINLVILVMAIFAGMTARQVIDEHKYEQTVLIMPNTPPPPPRINMPRIEPKPDLKPIQMEAKFALPVVKTARPAVILAPQPKAALAAAAMPAQVPQARPSTAPVHFGQTFGVTPNPNATRPATIAAIGNPYGGMTGPAIAPHGVVGSTGIGNGTRSGSNAGIVGKVASAGIPGATAAAPTGTYGGGKVAPAAIPVITAAAPAPRMAVAPVFTNLEVLSKPPVQYTSEAKQLRVQGEVVLRVTFTANGQVVVQSVLHGLGHGLDEEARRVAQQIRFRPATRDGQAVDLTTNITITFQLA